MEYLVGMSLALALPALPALTGIGRGRDFYPLVLIIVASYYVLFAATQDSLSTTLLELLVALVFFAAGIIGFATSLWWVAAALVGHGLLDCVHHLLISNAGVTQQWPGFCLSFDITAGLILAAQLWRGKRGSALILAPTAG